MPANQNPLGALPARFRRPRLLIVGFGDVGRRVAALPGMRSQRGPRVLALVRAREQFASVRACGAQPLLGDLDAPRSLRRLAGIATRVLHLAPPPAREEGAPGWSEDGRTRALLRALRLRGLPEAMVYASTTGVYGDCGGAWVDESRPPAPATGRARRRADAERGLRAAGRQSLSMRVSVLRIPGIYANDREGGTPQARLLRGTPVLRPEDDGFSNHVQADDLARLMSLALWRGRPQRIYHASDDTEMRMGEYFEWAARLYGLPPPPRISREQARQQLPASLLSFMGESRRLRNDRAKRELGWSLRYPTVAEGLGS